MEKQKENLTDSTAMELSPVLTADANGCPKGCKGLTYMHDDHEQRSCCVCGFVYANDTSKYIILNKKS